MSKSKRTPDSQSITWIEISKNALKHNIETLRKIVGKKVILAPSVKANAYGHGLVETSHMILSSGADWFCVNALFEAEALRKSGIKSPIYIMGYVLNKDLDEIIRLNCRLVVYNKETLTNLAKASKKQRKTAVIHIKVETGNNRQGIAVENLLDFVKFAKKYPQIEIEGLATHFANIEDIKNKNSPFKNYPIFQMNNFEQAIKILEKNGINIPIRHCANSAATLIFPKTHFEMVRPGIALYGLWPSPEVKQIAQKIDNSIELKPVLAWKTRIAQIKEVPKGAYIGYGCTYKTTRKTKIAILPVGYFEGYFRGLSNKSYVLIHGEKAPVRGRVCMNMMMVDVTKIPSAKTEDEVILIGKSGNKEISAEYLAEKAGTINYEITTAIEKNIPRIVVP